MNTLEQFQKALSEAYNSRLKQRKDGLYEVPTLLFLGTGLDLKMPPLPAAHFYVPKPGGAEDEKELLRNPEQPYSQLALSTHPFILVPDNEIAIIQKYAEERMLESKNSKNTPDAVKNRMENLRRAAIDCVDDLFKNPSPEKISKSKRVVGSFVSVLMRDPDAFLVLAQLSSHDPYTLTHSVGAGVNSIILARKIGIHDPHELEAVGMGGLLHDIGKTRVPLAIINKPGKLDDSEWAIMKQHSTFGYELVQNNPDIDRLSKAAILEHHEDKNKTGYPQQIPWDDVHIFSKIVAISDVYNALTTNRSYSEARPPFEAFKLMHDHMLNKLDEELFRQLVMVYGGKIDDLRTQKKAG